MCKTKDLKDISIDKILYEMISEYQKISNISPPKTSDIYIKLKTLSSQIYSLNKKLEWVNKQLFPQTASGKYLDFHAQTRGLYRKEACGSSGYLTFSVSSPAKTDILIPAKTVCYSLINLNIKYETKEDAIIKQGSTEIDVIAESTTKGEETNIKKELITNMTNPPQYVEKVVNKDDFKGGLNQESDEDLRKRLINSYKNISNGCNSSYYYNIAMNHEGVISANVIPRKRGRGTVDIIVSTTNKDKKLIEQIKQEMEKQKEINVDVFVEEAKSKAIEIKLSIEVNEINIFEKIKQEVKETIETHIKELKIYEPLKIAALGAKIFKINGIKNYKFQKPTKDVYIEKNEIITLKNLEITME